MATDDQWTDDQWADLRDWLSVLREEDPVPGDTLDDANYWPPGAFAQPLLARLTEEQPLDDRWAAAGVAQLPSLGRGTEEELMERVGPERMAAFWAAAENEVEQIRDRIARRRRFARSLPRRPRSSEPHAGAQDQATE